MIINGYVVLNLYEMNEPKNFMALNCFIRKTELILR